MTTTDTSRGSSAGELLAALRLASPALPIGAYAYSQGLEQAAALGHVSDRASVESWIVGVLRHAVGRLDLPILARSWRAWLDDDELTAARLDAWLLAGRESAELQAEERHLGTALMRLLRDTATESDRPLPTSVPASYVLAFALAAVRAGLDRATTMTSYCFAWLEHQVSAATRLIPLGQTDAQRVLLACTPEVGPLVSDAPGIPEELIGTSTPGLAIASALHETQHTRLFRS